LECFKQKNLSTDLNEVIADSIGIQIAYNAYQKWILNNKPEKPLAQLRLTTNQLFFISYSQIWCSRSKDRLIEPLLNFKKFSEAFKCTNQHLFNKKCMLF
jgi:predicted metalloendopeptidase